MEPCDWLRRLFGKGCRPPFHFINAPLYPTIPVLIDKATSYHVGFHEDRDAKLM